MPLVDKIWVDAFALGWLAVFVIRMFGWAAHLMSGSSDDGRELQAHAEVEQARGKEQGRRVAS